MGAVAAGQHKVLDDKVGEGRGHPFVERGSAVLFVTKKKRHLHCQVGVALFFFVGSGIIVREFLLTQKCLKITQ